MNIQTICHPFRFWGNHYLYDTNTDQILAVSKSAYHYFKNAAESSLDICEPAEELTELIADGYLMQNIPETVEHPLCRDLPVILERRISQMLLQVTQNCNLACSYCTYVNNDGSERMHSSNKMDWATAKKAIDFCMPIRAIWTK